MPSKILSAAISGLDARLIEVEVDISNGLHSFNIVGLPDKAVEESKERVGYAIKNCGLKPPRHQNQKVQESRRTRKIQPSAHRIQCTA